MAITIGLDTETTMPLLMMTNDNNTGWSGRVLHCPARRASLLLLALGMTLSRKLRGWSLRVRTSELCDGCCSCYCRLRTIISCDERRDLPATRELCNCSAIGWFFCFSRLVLELRSLNLRFEPYSRPSRPSYSSKSHTGRHAGDK